MIRIAALTLASDSAITIARFRPSKLRKHLTDLGRSMGGSNVIGVSECPRWSSSFQTSEGELPNPDKPDPLVPVLFLALLLFNLGCRKWGCNKWGFKGCLASLPGNWPRSVFFALFRPFSPFSGGCKEHLGNPENGRKRPFSSDIIRFT